jgi:large subunit ribosomal protein L21
LHTEFENIEKQEIMYAIVDIAGQQFKVQKAQKLYVHRLEGEAGSKVSFEKVLLIDNEGKVTIGNPLIKDAAVSAKVLDHIKADKVLVFKKKRRKGYRKLNGHRQFMTQIEITGIDEKVASKPAAKKEVAPKATEAKPAAAKAADEKKASAKPAAVKKPAAPKASTAKPAAVKKTAAPKAAAAKKPAAKKPAAKKTDTGDKASDTK